MSFTFVITRLLLFPSLKEAMSGIPSEADEAQTKKESCHLRRHKRIEAVPFEADSRTTTNAV